MAVEVVTKTVSNAYYSSLGTIAREELPEENLEILENFPELERSIRFLQKCWTYKDFHTPSFRKSSSRIVNCFVKALSHSEKEIFGVYQSEDPGASLLKRSVVAQSFWGNMIKNLRRYTTIMAASSSSASMVDGQNGSYGIKITEDAFAAMTIIENWDQVGNIVAFANDYPPSSIHVLCLRILDGVEIFRLGE